MSRRTPTEAQKQAAADRREKIRKLAQTISGMSERDRANLVGGGVATIEGHALSLFNQCLVLSQMSATVVGGFQQWRRAGRCVRKGEHGAAIWIPIGTITDEKTGKDRAKFTLGTVFDISQTDPINAEAEAVAA